MQIVEALADADVRDASGQEVYRLRAGDRYVLFDSESGWGLRDGALRLIAGLDRALPFYRGQSLARHRLILPFIGRQGDALVAASCLAALKERYPAVSVDVAAPHPAQEVLRLLPPFGEILPYPLDAELVGGYDFYLSFEEIGAVPRGAHRSYADVFSACLHTPRPKHPPPVTIPADVRARREFAPTNRPRVAIHVGRSDCPRSYPRDLLDELATGMVDAGCEVYLIGATDPVGRFSLRPTGGVLDLCGKTPSLADLAAVLRQMDALITGDSFPLHLAGAMGVATIALFTTTDAVIGSDYPSVVAIQSQAACSPCRVADGPCPLGHESCIAHRHPSLGPASIVEHMPARGDPSMIARRCATRRLRPALRGY